MDGWHRVANASFELDAYEFIHAGRTIIAGQPRSSRPWAGGGQSPTARWWRVSRHRDLGGEEELLLDKGGLTRVYPSIPLGPYYWYSSSSHVLSKGRGLEARTDPQDPSAGWNASDLDRMLLVASVLLVPAGPGAAALDRLWWKRDEVGKA